MLRLGIVDFDTSHCSLFTKVLNPASAGAEGARIVMGWPGSSRIGPERIPGYVDELKGHGVQIVGAPEEMIGQIDGVLILSNEGGMHLERARPFLEAGIPAFVDKPFAGSTAQAQELAELGARLNVPLFSSSALRFADEVARAAGPRGEGRRVLGVDAYGPGPEHAANPGLFHYGIHAVEMLYTLMGPGCESVTRVHAEGADVVTGKWKDGRVGTMRGIRDGKQDYGAVAFGAKANLVTPASMKSDYRSLLVEIVKFFQTGAPPVPPEETLEIMAFMEAADLSKARGGAPVMLKEVIEQKRKE